MPTIYGCTPPETWENMVVYPFLNKNKEDDYKMVAQLLDEGHIFFHPTWAECAGIVFCEAAAYGLPSISTDTGGVSSYISNNETGYILPLNAKAEEYAELIIRLYSDSNLYSKMAPQSRQLYESELNWKVWAKKIVE